MTSPQASLLWCPWTYPPLGWELSLPKDPASCCRGKGVINRPSDLWCSTRICPRSYLFIFLFFVVAAVPSSVPTSEALLPCRSSPPSATPRAHSASRPCPQRSTGGDVRSLVGCHPKETLHCCWVTSVVFSSACSDWTYAGHHLLCPLLMTMLAKSQSQTEWATPREQTAAMSLHQSSYVDSLMLKALIRIASGKGGGRNTETETTTRVWHEGLQKLRLFIFFIYAVIDEDEDDNWWSYGGPFSVWDYLTGPQTTLTVIMMPVLPRPGNCCTCSVGQLIRATPSKTHPWSGWSSAVWFQPSHWAHSTPSSG